MRKNLLPRTFHQNLPTVLIYLILLSSYLSSFFSTMICSTAPGINYVQTEILDITSETKDINTIMVGNQFGSLYISRYQKMNFVQFLYKEKIEFEKIPDNLSTFRGQILRSISITSYLSSTGSKLLILGFRYGKMLAYDTETGKIVQSYKIEENNAPIGSVVRQKASKGEWILIADNQGTAFRIDLTPGAAPAAPWAQYLNIYKIGLGENILSIELFEKKIL